MADESQVAMLKRSVEEWNAWRRSHDSEQISLEGADLRRADLSGAILNRAVLDHADLSFANLEHAYLGGASFVGANLMFARLSYSSLHLTDFRDTKLQGTNFTLAGLGSANFSGATLGGTVFNMVELGTVIGLEDCRHEMGSSVDSSTIEASPGLPESFLRGCGVPETVIASWRQISSQRLLFDSCFISHSSVDKQFAHKLREDLQKAGIKCWFAPHDILPGKKIEEQLYEAVGIYDRLLLILSEASMASEWVKTEIANARQKELSRQQQVLFPISIVPYEQVKKWRAFDADIGKDSAKEIREYYILDFTGWDTDHAKYRVTFEKLLKGLKAEKPTDAAAADE